MGHKLTNRQADALLAKWSENYTIFGPKRMKGEGTFSEIDVVRYAEIKTLGEIEWEKKSDYSFKEVLLPINETLFYFTEDETTVPKAREKDVLIFLRACDLHAVKRLDEIYLRNGYEDFYYARRREGAKFVLMGCSESCKSGFCVSMGTNRAEDYDAYLRPEGAGVLADIRCGSLLDGLTALSAAQEADAQAKPDQVSPHTAETQEKALGALEEQEVTPVYVTENVQQVTLPKQLSNESFKLPIWKEYGDRCITCGRCNFVCPTCTCFTMQDIFYRDNAKVGERRRVWASCQIDNYDTIAGGHGFRGSKADRMRFKVMHKIYDYEKRFGYPMCVGCGRCDDVCPEYISYSNLVNRLAKEEQ